MNLFIKLSEMFLTKGRMYDFIYKVLENENKIITTEKSVVPMDGVYSM